MTGRDERDVVELLLEQHAEFRRCFDALKAAAGEQKHRLFGNLVRLLAVHEGAEALVVHPVARRLLGDGSPVVEERLAEEKAIEDALSDLHDLGVGNPRFDGRFAAFARLALQHADSEERAEFPLLRDRLQADERRRMATEVRAIEDAAPGRPQDRAAGSAGAERPAVVFARIREAGLPERARRSPGQG
jgi:hemerythrin superfamily protein